MANKLILKKSSVATKVPLAADLDVGELAVNLVDQKLYSKKADGTVVLVGSGLGGSGDVQGAASSTDNAISRFNGTNGKVIQNSSATVDDNGNLTSLTQNATGTGANKLPVGNIAQRPTGQTGLIRFNSERNVFEGYDNSGWTAINAPPLNVEYLVVAGGGGGGGYGGGGGGGVLAGTSTAFIRSASYTVTVGAGGAGGPGEGGSNGSNSVVAGVVAIGGGGGAGDTNPTGKSGGSGGGGNRNSAAGGAGTSGQGNNGGAGVSTNGQGGGGGGWGGVGGSPSGFNSGAGGAGAANSISGSSVLYAGGGGAGANWAGTPGSGNTGGTGGSGGGGNGGTMNDATVITAPQNGTSNRGGGGGGRGYGSGGLSGANGGSGIVILKYPDAYTLTLGAGLTHSTTTSSGFKTTTITSGSDTISWSA